MILSVLSLFSAVKEQTNAVVGLLETSSPPQRFDQYASILSCQLLQGEHLLYGKLLNSWQSRKIFRKGCHLTDIIKLGLQAATFLIGIVL